MQQGKWAEAREHLSRGIDGAMGWFASRVAADCAARSAARGGRGRRSRRRLTLLNDLETVGIPPALEAQVAVLTGRLAEGLGRGGEALAAYRAAARSCCSRAGRAVHAAGRLREIVMRHELGEAGEAQVVNDLEILTVAWPMVCDERGVAISGPAVCRAAAAVPQSVPGDLTALLERPLTRT